MNPRFSIIENPMVGLSVIKATRRLDDRGFFEEVFRQSDFRDLGVASSVLQVNCSRSLGGIRRGLHFQWHPPMGKTMRVTRGEAFLVAVDIRKDSPTLGQWFGKTLSEDDSLMIAAPAGFARGFQSLADITEVEYFTTGEYNGDCEGQIRWNDEAIGIDWPQGEAAMSAKDLVAPSLAEWLASSGSDHFMLSGLG